MHRTRIDKNYLTVSYSTSSTGGPYSALVRLLLLRPRFSRVSKFIPFFTLCSLTGLQYCGKHTTPGSPTTKDNNLSSTFKVSSSLIA